MADVVQTNLCLFSYYGRLSRAFPFAWAKSHNSQQHVKYRYARVAKLEEESEAPSLSSGCITGDTAEGLLYLSDG